MTPTLLKYPKVALTRKERLILFHEIRYQHDQAAKTDLLKDL